MVPFKQIFNPSRDKAKRAAPAKPVTPQQKWMRGFIVVFGVFVLLCFLVADPILRHFRKSNFSNAQPRTGVATIAMVVMPQANFEGALKQEDKGYVVVRFQGHLCKVNNVAQITQMRENQAVKIVYLVGKRGDIAVDSAEPLITSQADEASTP